MLSVGMEPCQEVCQQMDKLRTDRRTRASSGVSPMGTVWKVLRAELRKPGPPLSADIYHAMSSCQELNTDTLKSEHC